MQAEICASAQNLLNRKPTFPKLILATQPERTELDWIRLKSWPGFLVKINLSPYWTLYLQSKIQWLQKISFYSAGFWTGWFWPLGLAHGPAKAQKMTGLHKRPGCCSWNGKWLINWLCKWISRIDPRNAAHRFTQALFASKCETNCLFLLPGLLSVTHLARGNGASSFLAFYLWIRWLQCFLL